MSAVTFFYINTVEISLTISAWLITCFHCRTELNMKIRELHFIMPKIYVVYYLLFCCGVEHVNCLYPQVILGV